MKRWTFAALPAIVLAFCLCLLPRMALAGEAEDQAAIKDLWATYAKLVVIGDVDAAKAWLTLYDAQGIQMPPGIPARPKSVLDEVIPKAWSPDRADAMNIDPQEIVILGDYAYTRGLYTVSSKAGDVDGKFMTILKRQNDGSWKIYRDIFNSNK
jgi:ketosteroid isomerase-like protein